MGILKKLIGLEVAKPVEAVGNVLDKLFTSDEERLDKQALLTKLAMQPNLAQVELNKVEASHRSAFVAGWRPAIGWVAAISLAIFYIPQYAVASKLWVETVLAKGELVPYPVTADGLLELVLALLGLGTLRTIEKLQGRSK
jgi:hypothetical protein